MRLRVEHVEGIRVGCNSLIRKLIRESIFPMTHRTVLITGGYGCIGSETAKWLIRNTDATIVIASRQVNDERTKRVFHDVDCTKLKSVPLDVTNQSRIQQLLEDHEVTHVVHLAAMQTPDCNAHRDVGLQTNLAGTQNLVEAMKASGRAFERYVFASSIAVYGPREFYPSTIVPMLAEPNPVNVYGAWKLAAESVSKFFWQDTGTPTISIRPGVLYGPGRDAGLTASPTTAMKCLALGRPYEIPFRSRQDYLYAPDVGGAIGHSLFHPFEGYQAFTLPSHTLDTNQIVTELKEAAEELGLTGQFQITVGNDEVPFICDLEYAAFLQAFPETPHTSLSKALRESLSVFVDQVEKGWLTEKDV